jgi:dihydroorotate dehydrogenase
MANAPLLRTPDPAGGWRSDFWEIIRPLLFRLDAEFVHEASIQAIRLFNSFGGGANRLMSGRFRATLPETSRLPQVFGKPFLSRVGLAAGFDKNGLILEALPDLGFGFAEVGTVTPRPQSGNPRPRLFRDQERRALFNRMGFNNDGAEKVAARVAEARERVPSSFRIGVNIGKNRDTPVERAIEDYLLATRPFCDLADLIVINVSSPNTPGLRALQHSDFLRPLLNALRDETASWVRVPKLV